MKKLLITGASGFLGWNLCHEAKKLWDVTGIFHMHPVKPEGVKAIQLDLTDYKALKKLFIDLRPDAVIHTAAAASPNYCQEHPAKSEAINIGASVNLAGLCSENGIPYVFTSTDLVFNGLEAPYCEEDAPDPLNVYGEQKVFAEEKVLNEYPETAVCRMPLMFGPSSPAYQTFFQQMLDALNEGNELKLFTDEYRTPVSAQTASNGLLLAVEKVKGIVHLGGIERISRYHFGLLMMDVMGIREAKLVQRRQKDVVMSAPKAPDLSLDSSKAFDIGYQPLAMREELRRLFKLPRPDLGN
jgi:dTDP-4-dehydrorhamnose reductase